jgi:hypothetical protein
MMKHHCNPLLRSWERYLKQTALFGMLRRTGRGYVASEVVHPRRKSMDSRNRKQMASSVR